MATKIFVNLPVKDLNKSIDYHGFMYAHGFQDLDGHIWELIYMEPSALNQD